MSDLRVSVLSLFKNYKSFDSKSLEICGWIRTVRNLKDVAFAELNDGSCLMNLQLVAARDVLDNFRDFVKMGVGSAVRVKGDLLLTEKKGQPFELRVSSFFVEGDSTSDYPLQKKRHSLEFLRTIAHLRARTNTYSAIFRVRSAASFAIHDFFNKEGFVYVHTPVLTGSDCEGAGEMFTVTTLNLAGFPATSEGSASGFSKDFFGKHASLTVSGQLEAECLAMALGKVYTFGPTFRAEKSYTGRHAAEFWMIEPEMAFANLSDNIVVAERMLKYVVNSVLEKCYDDLAFLEKFYEKGLVKRLKDLVSMNFEILSYTEAIGLLKKSDFDFVYKPEWGIDLQTEHERYLTESVLKKPVFVVNYPKGVKSFYMKLNDDGETVAAMDLLVPGVGEIIGGSERESNYDALIKRMDELGLKKEEYWWYLDLRKYGSATHSGYGLGFERLIMYLTGISNIRDVLPFPRTTGNLEF